MSNFSKWRTFQCRTSHPTQLCDDQAKAGVQSKMIRDLAQLVSIWEEKTEMMSSLRLLYLVTSFTVRTKIGPLVNVCVWGNKFEREIVRKGRKSNGTYVRGRKTWKNFSKRFFAWRGRQIHILPDTVHVFNKSSGINCRLYRSIFSQVLGMD